MSIRAAGFTLIEILVVLLIMGLSLGIVSLSIDSGRDVRQLLKSTEHLAREMKLSLQESEADGRQRGVALVRDAQGEWGWQWYRYTQGHWQYLDGTGANPLSTMMEPVLTVEGRPVPLADRAGTSLQTSPDIVFYASGEMTPFYLQLVNPMGRDSPAVALCGNALGEVWPLQQNELASSSCRRQL